MSSHTCDCVLLLSHVQAEAEEEQAKKKKLCDGGGGVKGPNESDYYPMCVRDDLEEGRGGKLTVNTPHKGFHKFSQAPKSSAPGLLLEP